MSLLSTNERADLIDLLLAFPDINNQQSREAILSSLPEGIRKNLPFDSRARTHLTLAVDHLEASAMQRRDGTWPVIWLIEQALRTSDPDSRHGEQLGSFYDRVSARADLTQAGAAPEAIVNTAAGFVDPELWLNKLQGAMKAVCKVETPTQSGTGFLVGSDLVMTNCHVIADILGNTAQLARVRFRFDYRCDRQGQELSAGKLYHIDTGRSIVRSQESDLDYALLPVKGSPGAEVIGERERGWLTPERQQLSAGMPLFIIQHPRGRYVKMAVGQIVQVSAQSLWHSTNTEPGSSGSPCFSNDLRLVAIHQGHDVDGNRHNCAIPFSAILEREEVRAALQWGEMQ